VNEQGDITKAGTLCPAEVARDLSKGAFETFRGLLQLALESIDLLRDVLKLSLCKHASFGNLVSGAIRSADCAPDSLRDSCESALPGHVYPPLGTDAILYHKKDYANLPLKKDGSKDPPLQTHGQERPRGSPTRSGQAATATMTANFSSPRRIRRGTRRGRARRHPCRESWDFLTR
jgi:hypothetical protein